MKNLEIANAKNDGVDFMRSEVNASNIDIRGAGDKGFSVGEMSNVRIDNAKIYASEIGIAVKDMSVVQLENSQLIENGVAISVYSKNWRFGGPGKLSIKSTEFLKNSVDLDVEENAEVNIYRNVDLNVTVGDGLVKHVH